MVATTTATGGGKISLRSAILLILVGAFLNEVTQRYRNPIVFEHDHSGDLEEETSLSSSSSSTTPSSKEGKSSQNNNNNNNNINNKKKKVYQSITPATSLPAEYKICKVEPSPIVGQPPVRMVGYRGLPIWYQCAGKPYDDFMYKVYGLIIQQQQQQDSASSKKWGKRKRIVPAILDDRRKKKRHRKVLVIGNSHTRQMISSLLCQYATDITSSRVLIQHVTSHKNVAISYYFENHNQLTLYVIINHPFVYSKTWKATLEIDILQHPLSELDAIILGTFNSYRESRGTSFLNTTLTYQEQFPHQGVDFINIKPPNLEDFVKIYRGPIIWTSMFAHYNIPIHHEAVQLLQMLSRSHNRTNLRSVNGRSYIAELGGEECSSNVGEIVSTCILDKTNVAYKNGHRCTGNKGGQPDLIAWDVIDALHDVLK